MARLPEVALLIDAADSVGRGLLRGIFAYNREHEPWSTFVPRHWRGDMAPAWLKTWTGGIIAQVDAPRLSRRLKDSAAAVVSIGPARLTPGLASVDFDHQEIVRSAFEHLVDRGFREFAYCGNEQSASSRARAQALGKLARDARVSLAVYSAESVKHDSPMALRQHRGTLIAWLRNLPKPCGVLAACDARGRQVLDACREAGIAAPDEIAVVGVGNDELLCQRSDPALSSVAVDSQRVGYAAAELLNSALSGQTIEHAPRLFEPSGVVARESSDVLASADAEVAAAMRFIRQHASDGIKVDDVLRVVPLSRRVLEHRFKKAVGLTIHEEILRVKLHGVKQLLEETDLPLAVIANRAGFKHCEYLSVVFKQHFRQSPGQCRAKRRE